MSSLKARPLAAALAAAALVAFGPSLQAASSAASSASDSVTASVGSSANSIQGSSKSSTGNGRVAQGDYLLVQVAAVAEQPGMVRLQLQPVAPLAADAGFFLILPQQVLAQSELAEGQAVLARHRSYGVEFSVAATRQAFYLVLDDATHRELGSHPVLL